MTKIKTFAWVKSPRLTSDGRSSMINDPKRFKFTTAPLEYPEVFESLESILSNSWICLNCFPYWWLDAIVFSRCILLAHQHLKLWMTQWGSSASSAVSCFLNPSVPKISLLILLTVCYTTLMMLVLRTWYWIN